MFYYNLFLYVDTIRKAPFKQSIQYLLKLLQAFYTVFSHQKLLLMLTLKPILKGLLLLISLFPLTLFAQETTKLHSETTSNHLGCGMASPTEEQIHNTLEVVARQVIPRNGSTTCVPLKAYSVRKSDGTGGVTTAQLNKALIKLNKAFLSAGIEFYWAAFPQYANNDDYFTYSFQAPDSDSEAGLRALFKVATDAINIYYVNAITFANGNRYGGYSKFPANNVASNMTLMTYVAIEDIDVHEMGHYLNLYHTHQGTENGNTDPYAENVARVGSQSNCSISGDLLCDTPADPRAALTNYGAPINVKNCAYNGTAEDIYGERYKPSGENIMSYFPVSCYGSYFTKEQNKRIAQALVLRQGFTAYTMTAPPMKVNNPSNLIVKQGDFGQALLNWQDNAENEMGYLIERSVSSDKSGFEVINDGAVDANSTNFTDKEVAVGKTYFYRVKATNDNCNDYSNTVEYTPSSSLATHKDKVRFVVQPNPSHGSFILTYFSEDTQIADLKIYDSFGRVVLITQFQPTLEYNQLIINLPSELPSGIYFISLNQNKSVKVAKVLKVN